MGEKILNSPKDIKKKLSIQSTCQKDLKSKGLSDYK